MGDKGDDIRVVLVDNNNPQKFIYLHNQSDKSQDLYFKAIEYGSADESHKELREKYEADLQNMSALVKVINNLLLLWLLIQLN